MISNTELSRRFHRFRRIKAGLGSQPFVRSLRLGGVDIIPPKKQDSAKAPKKQAE